RPLTFRRVALYLVPERFRGFLAPRPSAAEGAPWAARLPSPAPPRTVRPTTSRAGIGNGDRTGPRFPRCTLRRTARLPIRSHHDFVASQRVHPQGPVPGAVDLCRPASGGQAERGAGRFAVGARLGRRRP